MWETKQLLVHIDFDSRKNMEVTEDQQTVWFSLFLKIYVQQKKETHLGLKLILSKWWYKHKTLWQNLQDRWHNFYFVWTIPWTLIKQQNTEKNHSLLLTEKLEYSCFRNKSI